MPRKPVTLGPHHFEKKGDAAAYLQTMLRKYDVGDKVSADDDLVLRAALALHPQGDSKAGCGITHFSVRSADFGSKCFWANRSDGTTEKFSYKACIYG